jgi:hypothetical protein
MNSGTPDADRVAVELPGEAALVVTDLLLGNYIPILLAGDGGLVIPASLLRHLEPARFKVHGGIKAAAGCQATLTSLEAVALGMALLSFLVHLDEAASTRAAHLARYRDDAISVLVLLVAALGVDHPRLGRTLHTIGVSYGFFEAAEAEDGNLSERS